MLLGIESVCYHLVIVFREKVLLDGVWVWHWHHILLYRIATLNWTGSWLFLGVIWSLACSCVVCIGCRLISCCGCPCMTLSLASYKLLQVWVIGCTSFHINRSLLLFSWWNSLFFVDFWWNLLENFGFGKNWAFLGRMLICHQHSFLVRQEWVRFRFTEDIRVNIWWALEAYWTVFLIHVKL